MEELKTQQVDPDTVREKFYKIVNQLNEIVEASIELESLQENIFTPEHMDNETITMLIEIFLIFSMDLRQLIENNKLNQ